MTVFSPTAADLTSLEADPAAPPTKPVCDYATYMRLLAENADLQRTNGLLRLEAGKSGLGEAEMVEALKTELKILCANNKGWFDMTVARFIIILEQCRNMLS